ncbi:hypothetical protein C0J52_27275 [Blattella germanica]|nr:hypothetical protein C0J52_27275 [Blattella germanica]
MKELPFHAARYWHLQTSTFSDELPSFKDKFPEKTMDFELVIQTLKSITEITKQASEALNKSDKWLTLATEYYHTKIAKDINPDKINYFMLLYGQLVKICHVMLKDQKDDAHRCRENTTTALKITPNHKQRDDYTLVTKGPKSTTTPPSTNAIQTANKFQILQVADPNEEVSQTTEDHPPVIERQPPITVITDENNTFSIIRELNKSAKNLKISKVKDGIRIQATSPEDKQSVQNTCDRLKLETYTWAANSAKPIGAVIKRLPSDVPPEDLQEELKALKFDINSVTQMVKKVNGTKIPLPMYIVNLPNNEKSREVYHINSSIVGYMDNLMLEGFSSMRGLIAASDSHMGAILSDDLIFLAMGLLVVFASPSSSDDSPCLMGLSRLEWGSTSVFCAVTLFVEEIGLLLWCFVSVDKSLVGMFISHKVLDITPPAIDNALVGVICEREARFCQIMQHYTILWHIRGNNRIKWLTKIQEGKKLYIGLYSTLKHFGEWVEGRQIHSNVPLDSTLYNIFPVDYILNSLELVNSEKTDLNSGCADVVGISRRTFLTAESSHDESVEDAGEYKRHNIEEHQVREEVDEVLYEGVMKHYVNLVASGHNPICLPFEFQHTV